MNKTNYYAAPAVSIDEIVIESGIAASTENISEKEESGWGE